MPFYIFLFFLISFAFFDKALTAKYIFIERDLAGFFIPPKYLWVDLVKNFELPLWNPYNYSGIPLLATLQPGVFYPPHLFYLFLPFPVVWNWLIILHFVFAGTTVFLFLRYLKASNAGAFVGGVVFMLSGYLLSVHNLLPHLFSVSWFPLILMFFLQYLDSVKPRYLAYSSICLAMQFFAGAPEIVMMTVFTLVLITIFHPFFSEGNHLNLTLRFFALFVVFLLFALLSAVQLIPFYELSYHSIRRQGLPYWEAVTWSFAWKDFIQFFLPNPYGYLQSDAKYWANQSWLKTVYLGVAPFALSIFYFISKERRRYIFLFLMFISFIFALGGSTPIYKILYYIPPFNSVRYPVKFLFVFFFVMALTSGLGYDRLKQGIKEMDIKTQKIIKTVFYIGFIFAVAWGIVNIFNTEIKILFERYNIKPDAFNEIDSNIHNIKRFLLFSFFFCVMLLVCLRIKYKRMAFFALAAILTADLFLANYGYYRLAQWNEYIDKNPFEEKVRNRETKRYIVTPQTKDKFRSHPEDKNIMDSAYAGLYGLYTEGGMEVMRVADYEIFTNMLYGTKNIEEAKRFIDIAGIGYVISKNEIDEEGFELLDTIDVKISRPKKDEKDDIEEETVRLYRYKDSPGRFIIYNKAVFVKDEKSAFEKLSDKTIDLRSTLILIDRKTRLKDMQDKGGLSGAAKLIEYSPNRVTVKCDLKQDAFLYVSDTFYPGWWACIDGKNTEIYKANLAFRAVFVPKGSHTVVFRYVPLSFYVGIFFSLLGIFLTMWLMRSEKKA